MRAFRVATILGITCASLPSVVAAQSTGPEFKPLLKKVVRARCHMDVCSWFSIEAAEPSGNSPKGQLYKLTTKWWESEHKGGDYNRRAPRRGGEVATNFVFCSKQKPAVIDHDEDRTAWLATPLQPGNSQAVFGASETAYAMYWAACHDAIVEDVYSEGDRLGRKLGYRFSGDVGDSEEQQVLASPEDVLNW
jgi:hypothetical protein